MLEEIFNSSPCHPERNEGRAQRVAFEAAERSLATLGMTVCSGAIAAFHFVLLLGAFVRAPAGAFFALL